MKTMRIFSSYAVVVILTFGLLFDACKKDKDDSPAKYRIIESLSYEDGTLSDHSFFEYQGSRLSVIWSYYSYARGDSSKTTFSYPDNETVMIIDSYKEGSVWMDGYKTEMNLSGDQVTEEITSEFIEGSWEYSYKYEYLYDNGNLTLIELLYFVEGNWLQSVKMEFLYDGDKLMQEITSFKSTTWITFGKSVYAYNGDLIASVTDYEYDEGNYYESYKYEYRYTGNQLTSVESYEYISGEWVTEGTWLSFTYDSFGNVASWLMNYDDSDEEIKFIYEEGAGNIRQVYYTGYYYLDGIPFPTKASPDKRPPSWYRAGLSKD